MTVEQSWATIMGWCRANSPVTAPHLRPPAGEAALREAEQVTPRPWPGDLLRWYRLHDGAREHPYFFVLPSWMPLPLDEVVHTWRMYQEIYSDPLHNADFHVDEREEDEAGAVAGAFLPSFVPIGTNLSGWVLFVDTRPGPRHGCVTEFAREDADSWGVRWDSVAHMLEDVADSLLNARTTGHWRPRIVDGTLEWEIP